MFLKLDRLTGSTNRTIHQTLSDSAFELKDIELVCWFWFFFFTFFFLGGGGGKGAKHWAHIIGPLDIMHHNSQWLNVHFKPLFISICFQCRMDNLEKGPT